MGAAIAGHNSALFGMDEPRLRVAKLTKDQELEFAKLAERAASLLSALFKIAKKRIVGKRQGDEALVIRRVLFRYLKGRDCPVKLMARIFDLDRGQPGADSDAMELWEARNPDLDEAMEHIADGLDHFLAVKPKRVVRLCVSEMEADRAALAAVKAARDAADMLEAPTKKPARTFSPEVTRLHEEVQAKRRASELETAKRILNATIAKGQEPGATKEARKDADKARQALEEITEAVSKPKAKRSKVA